MIQLCWTSVPSSDSGHTWGSRKLGQGMVGTFLVFSLPQPSPAQPSPARARTQVKVGWWCWCACARAASPCSLYSALSCPPGPPAASPAQHALLCGSYFIHDSHFTACCCCPHCKLQQKQLREKIATLGRFAKLLFAQSARQPAVNLCFYGAENWNYY